MNYEWLKIVKFFLHFLKKSHLYQHQKGKRFNIPSSMYQKWILVTKNTSGDDNCCPRKSSLFFLTVIKIN